MPDQKSFQAALVQADTITIQTNDSNMAVVDKAPDQPLPLPKKIRKPEGIYRVVLPFHGKMEQTVAFYPDYTYDLQERYPDRKDSTVIIAGSWTPSDGYIWLYNDQVVRGRYKWAGDSLQYYSVDQKKGYTMNHMEDASNNAAWVDRRIAGSFLYGIGNEPFWSVEYRNDDTLTVLMAEGREPLRFKIHSVQHTRDSSLYVAGTDSTRVGLTVFPYFCNDGMSDYIYKNSLRLRYNNQVYTGCGIVFKKPQPR